jgi:hypothetical protein
MKFVSFINPVNLSEDPESGEDGDFYYNTNLETYRMRVSGTWLSVINNLGLKDAVNQKIEIFGDQFTESITITSEQLRSNSIFYIISASTSYVNITEDLSEVFPSGGECRVVRGGVGNIEIVPGPGVTLNAPSDIYLTATGDAVGLTKLNPELWLLEGNFPDLY